MTEQEEQWICNRFCIKLEHSSPDTIQMIQKASSYGKLVTGSFIATMRLLMHQVLCRVFGSTSNHPGDSVLLQPRIGALQPRAFPKIKITFEREEISDHQWDAGEYDRAADGSWENWVPTWKGTEASLSYVQYFLYLVSSSISVSIFLITWLDTFLTDLINTYKFIYINAYLNFLNMFSYNFILILLSLTQF